MIEKKYTEREEKLVAILGIIVGIAGILHVLF